MRRVHTAALAISLLWMFTVIAACGLAADAGLLTPMAAIVHWLVAGALPAALALSSLPAERG